MSDLPVVHLKSVDSTNLEARRLVEQGQVGAYWIRADEQTAGKGRFDRKWISPKGNLYTTLVLPIDVEPTFFPQLGFVTALAVSDVVNQVLKDDAAQLKWPNDCLVKGAKISGILSEAVSVNPAAIAIGCGINVASSPQDLPYRTCSLSDFADVKLDEVFALYDQAMRSRIGQWNFGAGFADIAHHWLHRAIGLGEMVTLRNGDQTQTGQYQGIFPDGSLMLVSDSKKFAVHSGDLHIPSLDAMRHPKV